MTRNKALPRTFGTLTTVAVFRIGFILSCGSLFFSICNSPSVVTPWFPGSSANQPPVEHEAINTTGRQIKRSEVATDLKNGHSSYGLLSDGLHTNISKWSPLVYSSCDTSWMPTSFAPCLAIPGAITKQELDYPDFKIRLPHFLNEGYKSFFLTTSGVKNAERFKVQGDWALYVGQHGQNIVYPGGVYTGMPTSGWHQGSCMGFNVKHQLQRQEGNVDGGAETVLISSSPDVYSFQHFLDRGTHIILQSEPHHTKNTQVWLGSRSPQPVVSQIIKGLSTTLSSGGKSISASKQVIFSCRAPLIHPYPSLRLLERLNINPLPIQQRKIVLYVGRKNSRNKGRNILNQDELVKKIEQLLQTRNKNETLKYFDHKNWATLDDMIPFFSNVAAVIGPHGGALFNQRWAGQDTLVLEFVPKSKFQSMFWEEASILNQNYWPFYLDSKSTHDMSVPIDQVVSVLDKHIGKPLDKPSLEHYYPWIIE